MADEAEDNLPPEGAEAEELAPVESGAEQHVEGAVTPPESAQTPSEVEELAREMGWAPKDHWRGDPEQWKDAKTFLKTTVEINRTLSKDVRGLKDTVDRLSRTSARIAERAIAEERAALEQQFRDAVAAGDEEGAYEASQALQRATSVEPADDPLADFKTRNSWFGADEEATAYAASLGEIHKGKPIDEQCRLIEAAVRKRFPEHFASAEPKPEPRPQPRAPLVSAPQTRSARPTPKEKGVADLPPEARKAGEDFVRRGRIGSLADYAKIYFEENA
ncbi:hypothetical protein [Phenylobacterium deserti]|uniref:Uncharacterized protein n=1 Tax=Phenylobacterium deserti TaxID=1914756 RepID=A0A328ABZ6_9CAUL|nr:hypothetical protein [Phenylobacterium deserti]RAK52125.1 hypothetical protein DJ018_13295 [Phenylobacterium deserti]